MKKFLSILVCVSIVLSVCTSVVFAADVTNNKLYTFEDPTLDYLTFLSVAGSTSFKDDNNVYKSSLLSGRMFSYESGIYGKNDKSQVLRIHSDSARSYSSGIVYCALHDSNTEVINDGRYYEMSLASSGENVIWDLQRNGSNQIILNNSPQWNPNGWNNVAVWLNNYSADSKYVFQIYVNGVEYVNYNTATKRLRLRGTIPNETKDALLAVDDFYSKTGAASYTPYTIPLSVDSTFSVDRNTNSVYPNKDGVYTVGDFKSMFTTDAAINVYDGELKNPDGIAGPASVFTTLKGDNDNIVLGDVVVLTENDGTRDNMLYLTVREKPIIKTEYNFDDKDLTLKPINASTTSTYSVRQSGLYTKDSSNKAYFVSLTPSKEAASVATRVELQSMDAVATQLIGKEKATVEFSMALDGTYNYGEMHFMYTIEGKASRIMIEPIRVFPDGSVQDHTRKPIGNFGGSKKWIRVGITLDPVECTCKTYVNGKLVEDFVFFEDFDAESDTFAIDRLSANINIPGVTGTQATLALDDVTIYSGDYSYEGALTTPSNVSPVSGKVYSTTDVYADFMDSVAVDTGATKTLYELDGDTYIAKTDSVNDGDVLVITSEDNIIKEYYVVSKESEFVLNNDITIIPGISNVTATTNGGLFKGKDSISAKAVFVLAIYQGDKLVEVYTDKKEINTVGKVAFSAVHNSALESGMTAKAFLWDSFDNMKPYDVDAASYEYIE